MSEVRLAVEKRTEFGKGAARRTRRAGKVPAVLYGHGSEPKHLSLPTVEFARVLRENGRNAVLTLEIEGDENETALCKSVTSHPTKNYLEHVDLLLVNRGEKVTVNVPVVITGEAAPGTLVTQDTNEVQVEADAMNIPEQIEVSIQDAEAGTQIHAPDLTMPRGATLQSGEDVLVVLVAEAPSEADMESEIDTSGAGMVEEASETANE
ncbi:MULTISPECIES: 50S ribosomal protein L25/general stress protein Ctc [Actinopolyspora]|uniref:Large ribosomal subunit protein bL25 n=1 Tax=Actinopolyspora saharensis TaxID=995062 RepID=A0A1H1GTL2_9ACTN|nr:50S ribosomal protein L25/general stress protein Ctc [Actinopolyspora saharensis]NHD16795.1 50S ribosomal protein L25/general stress protein Ctc [Actinopolyspora sp. BKK2]NHE75342.1 50S ribosomal protein L25/general stress protein Ctc [Actinopolyspora sp. BKK1]SDR16562.1 large subunit ribosomal protein L25 [Actinopolyspora saharensis]